MLNQKLKIYWQFQH